MSLLDKVPGDLRLYIGGLFTLRRKAALQDCGITHILSVLRLPLDKELFESYVHEVVEADDVDDENLLEHFPACNKFVQEGLDAGGGVLVHCAMGKSRSATIICAYLMQRYNISPHDALSQLREARPFCEPNDGFMRQLELYHAMCTPESVDESPAYQRWLYEREVELSRACGQAPEAEKIRFEDEHETDSSAADFELRCRKCRRALATSQYLVNHKKRKETASGGQGSRQTEGCSHYFLDPLSWMRPELEQGKLDGRLECPKCKTNVGKYAWQGMQCSCGDWVVPGISLAKGKIDEVKSRPPGAANLGIRMPPSTGRKSGPGHQNL
ncbi:tyrosine protein phosphatase yvh1 [Vermiconidia calcicola]|uniref:Tyrosine protein phosphatase yvh1 n=1 Tax=Vermiconidia calcicola TaxID=1690605 RepID=A0ACC3N0B1_9PEZI|nr:tyrosine protein phosphatase yvh1 [Vermiconidia calcicola]